VFFTLVSICLQGQQKEIIKRQKNEIKINTFTLIAFGAIDMTYETILNDESSVGLSVYLLGQNNLESEYYRTFFS
jgi:hypothetical protein